jgi:hypothetical protein
MKKFKTVTMAGTTQVLTFGTLIGSVSAYTMHMDERQRGFIRVFGTSYLAKEGRQIAHAMLQACDLADAQEKKLQAEHKRLKKEWRT